MVQTPTGANPLVALRESLTPFDASDLAMVAGALQLVPENADRMIRLEALAHLVASLPHRAGRPHASRARILKLCNDSVLGQGQFAAAEDPCDNALTESFTFYGGSHIVFPGMSEGALHILRHLSRAIFLSEKRFPDTAFRRSASRLLSATLAVSDEIAARAGLPRHIHPMQGSGRHVTVPTSAGLDRLKRAVRFEQEALDDLLRKNGATAEVLAPLTVEAGAMSVDAYQLGEPPLAINPLVRFDQDIIVPSPSMVAVAARFHLMKLATEHRVMLELMERYVASIWDSTAKLLRLTQHVKVLPCPDKVDIPFSRQSFFALDTDKLAFVLLVGDDLEGYEGKEPFGYWQSARLNELIGEQFKRAEAFAYSRLGANELLCLLVLAGFGRAFAVVLRDGPTASHVLMLPSYDLETLLLLEAANPLALWKFARERERNSGVTRIITDSALNEYYYFRKRHYSYYMADDFRPTHVTMLPGGAGEMRREVLAERDWHAANSYSPGAVIEVMTLHDTASIPIYTPIESIGGRVTLLVEGLPVPVWLMGPEYSTDNPRSRTFHSEYLQFADTVAYWLWQMTPSLGPALGALSGTAWSVVVQLRIVGDDDWKLALRGVPFEGPPIEVTPEPEAGSVLITLRPSLVQRLMGASNEGEREMMTEVLRGLRAILPSAARRLLSEESIREILDTHAPIGLKKKLILLPGASSFELDDSGLPRFRKVQQSDVNCLLDDLGEHLANTENVSPGRIQPDQRVDFLNSVVHFLYQQLEMLVHCHSMDSLLPWLVAYNEAAVHQEASRSLTIPTSIACFGSQLEMLEQLKRELPEISAASVAGRFLVEFASARPPSGLRRVSLDSYDRLLALASHIVTFGMVSDLIRFQLADIEVSVLKSGRVGFQREELERAQQAYLSITTMSHIERAGEQFAERWSTMESRQVPSETRRLIDAAAIAEWGHSMTDITRLMSVAHQWGQSMDSSICRVPRERMLDYLAKDLGWEHGKVEAILDLLILGPRTNFLQPTPPFTKTDVYPWRYNRALSYLRRPFVAHSGGGRLEVIWGPRHLKKAMHYWITLCTSGRLRASSGQMLELMGRFNRLGGEAFNNKVADAFESHYKPYVRCRVTCVRTDLKKIFPPGDIDVMAADVKHRRLFVVECKDLALARTPAELSNELGTLFTGHSGKKSTTEKHRRRAQWVTQNIDDVATWLGLPGKRKWKVIPCIVVSEDLFTPYLRGSSMNVISLRQLRRNLGEEG